MRWISRLPGQGEWARVVQWRTVQLERLRNVTVIPDTRLDAGAVREYGGDIVVIATGARWTSDGVTAFTHAPIPGAGAGQAHVLTPEDVMVAGRRPPGERVVVYDAEGYFTAPGVAELLAREGHHVELVTCLDQVSPVCDQTLEGPMLRRRLHNAGVTLRRAVTLTAIDPGRLAAVDEFDRLLELEAHAVVLVTHRRSDDALYRELAADPGALEHGGIEALHRVGDCVAPRIPADAIFDGHRLAREIDADRPAVPLPYLREHARVAAAGADRHDGRAAAAYRVRPAG